MIKSVKEKHNEEKLLVCIWRYISYNKYTLNREHLLDYFSVTH